MKKIFKNSYNSKKNKQSLNKEKDAKNFLAIGFMILVISLIFPKFAVDSFIDELLSICLLFGLIISYIGYLKLSDKTKKKSQEFLSESRPTIFIVLGLFVFSVIVGFSASNLLHDTIMPIIQNMAEQLESSKGLEIILDIFINNLSASFIGLFAGIIFLFSLWVTITNGAVIGYVLAIVYEKVGASEFWMLAPHGVFELPAILISLALGLRMGLFFTKPSPGVELRRRFFNSFLIFLRVVVPLLVIAAIIEGLLILIIK